MNKLLSLLGIVTPNTTTTKSGSGTGLFDWLFTAKKTNTDEVISAVVSRIPASVKEKYFPDYGAVLSSDLSAFHIYEKTSDTAIFITDDTPYYSSEDLDRALNKRIYDKLLKIIEIGGLTKDELDAIRKPFPAITAPSA